jgi:cell division protein FtsL
VNVSDEATQVEETDATLRRLEITNKALLAVSTVVLIAIYARILMGNDASYQVKRRLKKLRRRFFGPTEEEIKVMVSQVQVEANRVVRRAEQ